MQTTPSSTTPDTKRRALGRGIESLLPPLAQGPNVTSPAADGSGTPREIPLDLIDRNPYQTRSRFDEVELAELAASIASLGVVQPVIVREILGGRFQLINGERRLLASRKAERSTIPAILRVVSDQQAMEMTIVENLQRADLNPMEQARAYLRLANEFKLTQEQMAARTGLQRASVANFLRLLKLPESIQHRVEAGELSFGHAKILLGLPTPEQIIAAAQKVLALTMSVRQTETFVHGLLNPEAKPGKAELNAAEDQGTDPNVRAAQLRLQRSLGLKVRIEDKQGKGRVIIEYAHLEDFDALLNALGGAPRADTA